MKTIIYSLCILRLFLTPLSAQSVGCVEASWQLHNYVSQVNRIYRDECWRVIPLLRCPDRDAWGNYYNPGIVQSCRFQMYTYLNNWYREQCYVVNTWYTQIGNACNYRPAGVPAPTHIVGADEVAQINTDKVEDLKVGVDENRAVRITIPTTAEGFKPNE